MIWPVAYLAAVVAVNASFLLVPMLHVAGQAWSIGSVLVGGVFVLRDMAQRAIGHWVLAFMIVGIALTAAMSPQLAAASGLAFAAGEGVEWVIFTVTRKPLRERIVLSCIAATVVDSVVFLKLAGFYTGAGFVLMCLSKLIALASVRWIPNTAREAAGRET